VTFAFIDPGKPFADAGGFSFFRQAANPIFAASSY